MNCPPAKGIVISALVMILLAATSVLSEQVPGPKPPEGLKLSISEKGVLLTWQASADDSGKVTGYEIARAELASGPFKTIGKVDKGMLKYTDKKAKKEIIYYYKVRATVRGGHSDWSNAVTGERAGF